MCHLILLMPLIALPVFWLMPVGYATSIYVVISLASGFLYWMITRAMRQPVRDGFRSLIGTEVEVVSTLSPIDYAQYLVRSGGELWGAQVRRSTPSRRERQRNGGGWHQAGSDEEK